MIHGKEGLRVVWWWSHLNLAWSSLAKEKQSVLLLVWMRVIFNNARLPFSLTQNWHLKTTTAFLIRRRRIVAREANWVFFAPNGKEKKSAVVLQLKDLCFPPSPLLAFYKPHSETINFEKGCFSPLFWMKHWHHLEKYTLPMWGRPALSLRLSLIT